MANHTLTPEPKMAHVNMMVDTVIGNLPEDGLRSVLRAMLATDPSITSVFEDRARNYLQKTATVHSYSDKPEPDASPDVKKSQQHIRAMLGCGMVLESVRLLKTLVNGLNSYLTAGNESTGLLDGIDGDIVQALTAVQKTLFTNAGIRELSDTEKLDLENLRQAIRGFRDDEVQRSGVSPLERSLAALDLLLQKPVEQAAAAIVTSLTVSPIPSSIETFLLDGIPLPRLFTGLWQLSSPSWGSASFTKIQQQFLQHANRGFTAFDMADHYGDAEVLFGRFRYSVTTPSAVFGATKYCVFTPMTVTKDAIAANVTERCHRMAAAHVDLLQFHWQDYNDEQYVLALKYLQEDPRVKRLGLCNFDTEHMDKVIDAGIKIHTNQVQFSLIDSRPLHSMSSVCAKHNIKLLTYGTLCGGFLSEKWLGKPEPTELFAGGITPSQRKYYEMILNWGGWSLFQELLTVLKSVANERGGDVLSISNVATRWVLDHDCVGAVIVGTRMGVSDNSEVNLKTYGWNLSQQDRDKIGAVLKNSRKDQMVDILGDCGGEYR